MQHTHKINDRDPYFEIDAVTRKIVNKSSSKVSIIQYDHNSERFTFVLPRYIEEHDMSEVTKAEVHYMSGKTKTPGIYTIKDLAISPEDEDMVVCTWLLSQNVTMETGAISFVLRLSCIGEDGSIEYAWSTAIFTGISVAEGIYNTEAIVEQYADVLEQWKEELQNSGTGGGGGSVENDAPFVVTFDEDDKPNKDYSEIVAAITAGKRIVMGDSVSDNIKYGCLYSDYDGDQITLVFWIPPTNGTMHITGRSNNSWRTVYESYVTRAEVEEQKGNIETALDAIIEIQNALIGGDGV